MKRLLKIGILLSTVMLLYACPTESKYPLGNPNTEDYDKQILGVWELREGQNEYDAEALKFEFTVNSTNSSTEFYTIIEDYSTNYSLNVLEHFGYMTELDGIKFLYFKPDDETSDYFHYAIKELNDNELIVCAVVIKDDKLDAINSTQDLRKEVSSLIKSEKFWDKAIVYNRVK